MNMPNLELYYFSSCPFCQSVLKVIEELSLDVTMCNTREVEAHAEKLLADTGRRTVPCLYIDGKPMHESRDIIDWLQANKDQLKKK